MTTETEHRLAENPRERRHMGVRDIVATVVLILNFGGLVWGAATMSSTVAQLKESVTEVRDVAQNLVAQMGSIREDYGARLRLLEMQVGDLRKIK